LAKLILAVLFHVFVKRERESTADDGAYVTVELDGLHLLMIPIFLKLETTHSAMNPLRIHSDVSGGSHRQSSVSLIFSYSAHAVFLIFPVFFAGSQAKPFVSCDIADFVSTFVFE
jgi:hypothetical protein